MTDYTNPSKNSASYSNLTENTSSVLSFLLTEDGYYIKQQDDYRIGLEQDYQFGEMIKRQATYTNLSK
jgi:hypothetical protein